MLMKSALILIPEKIGGLLNDYAKDLEEAWANVGDGEVLSINLSAKIGFDKVGKPACEVKIGCVKEKIEGSVKFSWDDKQAGLFKVVKVIDEKLRREGNSMTISDNEGKSVTLGKKG